MMNEQQDRSEIEIYDKFTNPSQAWVKEKNKNEKKIRNKI